ncbi:hypothetical protein C8R44DRAFT_334495 [Mycena epipterygia]|nr:hypothetical protein C8R44DRAFT_334495 [Mycena epipterygia]
MALRPSPRLCVVISLCFVQKLILGSWHTPSHRAPASRARAFAIASFAAGVPVGGALSMVLSDLVTQLSRYTWRAQSFLSAAIAFATLLTGMFLIPADALSPSSASAHRRSPPSALSPPTSTISPPAAGAAAEDAKKSAPGPFHANDASLHAYPPPPSPSPSPSARIIPGIMGHMIMDTTAPHPHPPSSPGSSGIHYIIRIRVSALSAPAAVGAHPFPSSLSLSLSSSFTFAITEGSAAGPAARRGSLDEAARGLGRRHGQGWRGDGRWDGGRGVGMPCEFFSPVERLCFPRATFSFRLDPSFIRIRVWCGFHLLFCVFGLTFILHFLLPRLLFFSQRLCFFFIRVFLSSSASASSKYSTKINSFSET